MRRSNARLLFSGGRSHEHHSLVSRFHLFGLRNGGPSTPAGAPQVERHPTILDPVDLGRAGVSESPSRKATARQYIRQVLLGDGVTKRQLSRRPQLDDQKVAMLLSGLGQSRLSSNLNQLAKSANMGTLEVDDDIRQQLEHACAAIIAMREALLIALRMNPRG